MAANTFSCTPVSPPFRQPADSNSQGTTQKRQRHPSRKALQSAIQEKATELGKLTKTLQKTAVSVYDALHEKAWVIDKTTLERPTQKYEEILSELQGLYAEDKWGDALNEAERVRELGQSNLEYARTALSKAKSVQFHDQFELMLAQWLSLALMLEPRYRLEGPQLPFSSCKCTAKLSFIN